MQVLTVVSSKYNKGEVNWEPKDIQEAKMMIEHMKSTMLLKDKRIAYLTNEQELLLNRIMNLKILLGNVGIKYA